MFTVIIFFGLLSAIAALGTVRALRDDGYHRVPTDRSRLP